MRNPIFRKASEWKDKGQGYVIFGEEAEIIESNVITVKKGESTSVGSHHNEEEVYVALSGRGKVRIGNEEREVDAGTVMYIPRNTEHQSTCLSDEDYVFLCVAVYFDRAPDEH